MIRRVNTVLSVASLLLCILMLAGWGRSFWVCDSLSRSRVVSTANPAETITHSVFWEDGVVGYALIRERYTDKVIAPAPVAWQLEQRQPSIFHGQTLLERIGFYGRMRESTVLESTVLESHLMQDTDLMQSTDHAVARRVHVVHSYTRDHWEIPGFLPAMAFAIYPAIRGYRRFRRRGKSGLCRNCNYDLTGNTSGVCPECGTALQLTAIQPWR